MSDEIRMVIYEDGSHYIVNFTTGDIYSEYTPMLEAIFDEFVSITYKDKKYISLVDITHIKCCLCKKKVCPMKFLIKDAKRIMKKVLQDACDS